MHLEESCPKKQTKLKEPFLTAKGLVCCQANGLAYASTMGWMRVEPQQRDAHPSEEDRGGSMNLPTSVEERVSWE
jgi:nitrite reductase/ring-hydroxylating ferredoxin subunit